MDGAQVRAELFAQRSAPLAAIVVISGAEHEFPVHPLAAVPDALLIHVLRQEVHAAGPGKVAEAMVIQVGDSHRKLHAQQQPARQWRDSA